MRISADQLSDVISVELENYNRGIISSVKKVAEKETKKLVKQTKSTAPVGNRHKHYRDSITYKKIADNGFKASYLWYVKGSDYRLSHLLNDGHQLKRDGEIIGEVPGTHFITNAYVIAEKAFEEGITEVLENGK